MIKLRITPDGCIRGLWSDHVQLTDLGTVHVRRASHVEFDEMQQCWTVREAAPRNRILRLLQHLRGRPIGGVLHHAYTRASALAWENEHFQPGGPGWRQLP